MTTIPKQEDPVGVRPARRRGEAQSQWTFHAKERRDWVETTVWTEHMLDALENGVKGDRTVFHARGLFNLTAAHVLACQSSREVNH